MISAVTAVGYTFTLSDRRKDDDQCYDRGRIYLYTV